MPKKGYKITEAHRQSLIDSHKGKGVIHGLSKTKFYNIWSAMRKRCGPNGHKNYRGRGIKVEWTSFLDFKNDMYQSYLEHIKAYGDGTGTSIERVNNYGNYSKENCRWATQSEQINNTRYNVSTSMANLCRTLGLSYGKVQTMHFRKKVPLAECIAVYVEEKIAKAKKETAEAERARIYRQLKKHEEPVQYTRDKSIGWAVPMRYILEKYL